MEAFCVCEPWNDQLVHQKIGYTALTTGELWNMHPEKSLGLRASYVDKNPKAAAAMLMAVMEAQQWCEKPEHAEEMCSISAKRNWMNAPVSDILDRAKGRFDYGDGRIVEKHPQMMRFWDNHASYPFQSHDLWFLTENQRWGYQPMDLDTKALIAKVNREDMWKDAAKALGVPDAQIPASTSRGTETFFDGKVFDPENPKAYLDSLAIKKIA
jgi:nitrate/nitrite transport system substrate-binding protein